MFGSPCIKNLQENKHNSLTRKLKKTNVIRTVHRTPQPPSLTHSGRRVSENSEFYISVIAYLDRIRKAKGISLRRRPRHRRHRYLLICLFSPEPSSLNKKCSVFIKFYTKFVSFYTEENIIQYLTFLRSFIPGPLPISFFDNFLHRNVHRIP